MHHVFSLGHIINWAPIVLFVVVALSFRRLQAALLAIPPLARLILWFAIMGGIGTAFYLLVGHPLA